MSPLKKPGFLQRDYDIQVLCNRMLLYIVGFDVKIPVFDFFQWSLMPFCAVAAISHRALRNAMAQP